MPNNSSNKATASEDLIHKNLKVVAFVIINNNPNAAVFRKKPIQNFQSLPNQRQPKRVLHSVIIMLKCASGIIRRINKHAFHLARELLFERFEREKIVPENKPVIKQVVVRHAVLCVVGFGVVRNKNTRLQPRPVLFPDPSEFEFGFL